MLSHGAVLVHLDVNFDGHPSIADRRPKREKFDGNEFDPGRSFPKRGSRRGPDRQVNPHHQRSNVRLIARYAVNPLEPFVNPDLPPTQVSRPPADRSVARVG